jgi:predicted nucleic acid-binding protein
MDKQSVLCDTSFFIRLLDPSSPLHENAKKYFRYFLQQEITMVISTISVAEYCVGGEIEELPLLKLQMMPFNFEHSKRTGQLARIVFQHKDELKLNERNIIPNDTKLFAQADSEKEIQYYLSSDSRSMKIYHLLQQTNKINFQFIDLHTPYHETFGVFDF